MNNFKTNLSFCYRAFITSFKQLLGNSLKLEVSHPELCLTLTRIYDGTFCEIGLRLNGRRNREKNVCEKNKGF